MSGIARSRYTHVSKQDSEDMGEQLERELFQGRMEGNVKRDRLMTEFKDRVTPAREEKVGNMKKSDMMSDLENTNFNFISDLKKEIEMMKSENTNKDKEIGMLKMEIHRMYEKGEEEKKRRE